MKTFTARHAIGKPVKGAALVAHDGFSARYDLDRVAGTFSRPAHRLAGQSYAGRILVLDTAKGGVASAWMLHEMASRGVVPLALVFNSVNPILAQGAALGKIAEGGDGAALDLSVVRLKVHRGVLGLVDVAHYSRVLERLRHGYPRLRIPDVNEAAIVTPGLEIPASHHVCAHDAHWFTSRRERGEATH